MQYGERQKLKESFQNIKPSHQEATRIKEGWQMDMYEKEITNYSGKGPVIRVYGNTSKEAEELAIVLCDLVRGIDRL